MPTSMSASTTVPLPAPNCSPESVLVPSPISTSAATPGLTFISCTPNNTSSSSNEPFTPQPISISASLSGSMTATEPIPISTLVVSNPISISGIHVVPALSPAPKPAPKVAPKPGPKPALKHKPNFLPESVSFVSPEHFHVPILEFTASSTSMGASKSPFTPVVHPALTSPSGPTCTHYPENTPKPAPKQAQSRQRSASTLTSQGSVQSESKLHLYQSTCACSVTCTFTTYDFYWQNLPFHFVLISASPVITTDHLGSLYVH